MLWSFLAAISAVTMEYAYRRWPNTSWQALALYMWPLMLVISYSICKLVRAPGVPLVGALIMWSFCIIGLRVFVTTVMLKDTVPTGTWVALGLMVAARISQTVWR